MLYFTLHLCGNVRRYSNSGRIRYILGKKIRIGTVMGNCLCILFQDARILTLTLIQVLNKSFCIRNTDIPIQAEESKGSAIKLIRYNFVTVCREIRLLTHLVWLSPEPHHFACEPYWSSMGSYATFANKFTIDRHIVIHFQGYR